MCIMVSVLKVRKDFSHGVVKIKYHIKVPGTVMTKTGLLPFNVSVIEQTDHISPPDCKLNEGRAAPALRTMSA